MRPIFYDTETTGIRANSDKIIELAAIDPERDATFEMLINPECLIPPEATAVHKITDEMVADKPLFSEVAQEFMAFCEGEVCLIAHNNDGFDRPFLRSEFERAGVEIPEWHYFDTLKWSRRYRPDLPRHTLQFLREVYGIEENNAHRALDDVVVLQKIYEAMVDDLSIETVLDLISENKPIRTMPFGKYRGTPLEEVPDDYIKWLKKSGAFDKPDNQQLKEALESLCSQ